MNQRNPLPVLGGRYEVWPLLVTPEAYHGDVMHVDRGGKVGGKNCTPVGELHAFRHPGEIENINPHWCVCLFLRSDIRYQASSNVTEVVGDPDRIAGPNAEYRRHLEVLRDSTLPPIDSKLPRAVAVALLAESICCEPLALSVKFCTRGSWEEFGDVIDDG